MATPKSKQSPSLAGKENIRTGGRSARVQESIHAATRDLLSRLDRAAVTVPVIAAQAGVTPSTIYRRWGDLTELLADVAMARLRPDTLPLDTGSVRGDLHAWVEGYLDEMSSALGQSILRDVLACQSNERAQKCATLVQHNLDIMRERALARSEPTPDSEALINAVVAPMIYRILFADQPPSLASLHVAIDECLAQATKSPR